MKRILLSVITSLTLSTGFSQVTFHQSDPGFLGFPKLYDTGGNPTVDQNALNANTNYTLKLGFQESTFSDIIPNNDIQIQIDLGSKLTVTNPASLATAPGSTWFTWTLSSNAGDQVIVGTQKAGAAGDIPAGTSFTMQFLLTTAKTTGASGISANILIPNNNPTDQVADPVDPNNSTSSAYSITTTLPVKFVNIDAQKNNCTVNVNWSVGDQQNASSYTVEASKDGGSFVPVVTVPASSSTSYNASFALTTALQADVLYVRVRETDADGRTTISDIRTVSGTCGDANRLVIFAYPNPVTSSNYITIGAKEGLFSGKYKLQLFDNSGKLYQVKETELNNVRSVQFEFNTALTPGNYMIRVSTIDGTQVGTVQFVKVGVL